MIYGIIHKGSGLGDQLFSYVATRVRAADLGVPYGFIGQRFFKGAGWMHLDWGEEVNFSSHVEEPSGKVVVSVSNKVYELNKPSFDEEFNSIPDESIIDGYGAQDIKYFEHRLDEVREWLKVEPLEVPENVVIVNFRGGEYQYIPELYLTKDYWSLAKTSFDVKSDHVYKFDIHTDDPDAAARMFNSFTQENFPLYKDIALNWRSIRYAKHLIISNSAFAILPALLNENVKEIIAPEYWAGRNVKEWRRPGNKYNKFTYL